MRLSINTTKTGDVTCPHCKTAINVNPTYEDNQEDCHNNSGYCPKCNELIRIKTALILTATKLYNKG
jgi:hypothetical protein